MTKNIATIAKAAKEASRHLSALAETSRNQALEAMARAVDQHRAVIVEANRKDLTAAEVEVAAGRMTQPLFKRLELDDRKLDGVIAGIRDVGGLPDPLGQVQWAMDLDDGLRLERVSCPIGVLGIVFESRPDVVPQISSLAVKSGNAVILKGGHEAEQTNRALLDVLRRAAGEVSGFPVEALQLLTTREEVGAMLSREEEIDLIIPRGSKGFVRFVQEHTKIPVLGHTDGNCHVYIHGDADLEKALRVVLDSKLDYPAACNAAESLLIDRNATSMLEPILSALLEKGVEIRACARTRKLIDGALAEKLVAATEEDWGTEYLDLILSVKMVNDLDEAIEHINRYGSAHTEAIVTEDQQAANKFLDRVDSAGVFHNASTRFADGFRYGLGAEVGISTLKIHARGPVGLEGLLTYRYRLHGDGHAAGDYGPGKKSFLHRQIKPR